jgi:deazaflavin-dependent oxidoreductase (nitroreductase family)
VSAPTEPEHGRSLYERVAIPLVSSRAGSWFYVHVAPHLDRGLLRLTGGRLTTAGRGRVGFLTVRGARSGAERITPLVWTADGDDVLLVASRGGDVKHPAWYRNVVANPEVRFSIDGVERPYRARDATRTERPRLWELANRRYPGYATYQRRAGVREIPIVVLEPRS